MKKIIYASIIVVIVLVLFYIMNYTNTKYNDNEFKGFEEYINLDDTVSIKTSHNTKYNNDNQYITSSEYINEIINYLYSNSLAYMKDKDKLPNEAPDFFLVFTDSNNSKKAYLMFYGGGYIVNNTNGERYKVQQYDFTNELITKLEIWNSSEN